MLCGELYDCGDPELLARWHLAKDLAREYQACPSADREQKMALLDQLLGGHGADVWITAPFYVDYGENIYLGNHCEINMNCTFLDDHRITIGDYALIAPNVQIYTAYHPTHPLDRFTQQGADGFCFCKTQSAPVTIGHHVWIGGGAILLPGVTIGDNVVIGSGSVVTHDIPSNMIAVGSPCKVIKENKPLAEQSEAGHKEH